jgi:hypothetical protein
MGKGDTDQTASVVSEVGHVRGRDRVGGIDEVHLVLSICCVMDHHWLAALERLDGVLNPFAGLDVTVIVTVWKQAITPHRGSPGLFEARQFAYEY